MSTIGKLQNTRDAKVLNEGFSLIFVFEKNFNSHFYRHYFLIWPPTLFYNANTYILFYDVQYFDCTHVLRLFYN